MARFQFSKYCTPAQLYLVVAGIGLLAAAIRKFRALTLLANGILVLVWTWILNLLCRKGLTAISWILVLLPFVFMASSYFLAMDAADAKIVEGSQLMFKLDSDMVDSSADLEFEAPTAAGGDIPTLGHHDFLEKVHICVFTVSVNNQRNNRTIGAIQIGNSVSPRGLQICQRGRRQKSMGSD